jgi:protein TonB
MKRSLLSPAVLAAILSATSVPPPASANVFCPATIATLADVSFQGRPNTYGFLLEVDRGDTRSVRVRVDTDATRYAIDVNDVPLMTFNGLRLTRYFTLPAGEHPAAAWVQSTGLGVAERLECPITAPWSPNAAPPVTPSGQLAADRDRKTLVDGFGAARNAVVTPTSFGPAAQQACSHPFAAAHALAPIKPAFPPEARAVNATGVVELTVDVDDTGALVGAAVSRSSGFAPLDRAALETAKHAKYAAATFSCRPTATTLTLTTGFGV